MSIIDVLEEIGAPTFPIVIPRCSLVWALIREAADEPRHQGMMTISQRETVLATFPVDIDFQESLFTRSLLVIGGLAIPAPGTVDVTFEIPNVVIARFRMDAIAVPQVVGQDQDRGPAAPRALMI